MSHPLFVAPFLGRGGYTNTAKFDLILPELPNADALACRALLLTLSPLPSLDFSFIDKDAYYQRTFINDTVLKADALTLQFSKGYDFTVEKYFDVWRKLCVEEKILNGKKVIRFHPTNWGKKTVTLDILARDGDRKNPRQRYVFKGCYPINDFPTPSLTRETNSAQPPLEYRLNYDTFKFYSQLDEIPGSSSFSSNFV